MEIKAFATRHKLRVKQLDGEPVIPCKGKTGCDYSHIYYHGKDLLAAMYFGTPRTWGNVRRACAAAGCRIWQDGDAEGTVLFDPGDEKQTRTVLEWVEARRKRQLSPESLERLAIAAQKGRESMASRETSAEDVLEGPSSEQDDDD